MWMLRAILRMVRAILRMVRAILRTLRAILLDFSRSRGWHALTTDFLWGRPFYLRRVHHGQQLRPAGGGGGRQRAFGAEPHQHGGDGEQRLHGGRGVPRGQPRDPGERAAAGKHGAALDEYARMARSVVRIYLRFLRPIGCVSHDESDVKSTVVAFTTYEHDEEAQAALPTACWSSRPVSSSWRQLRRLFDAHRAMDPSVTTGFRCVAGKCVEKCGRKCAEKCECDERPAALTTSETEPRTNDEAARARA
eukprot:1185088-Prorocentrum_minimum.AAC.3